VGGAHTLTSATVDITQEGHQAPEGALSVAARARRDGMVRSGSVKWFFPMALALSVVAGSFEVWPQLSEARKDKEKGREDNSIHLIVDGVPRKTWTVGELMAHKFDFVSRKGRVSPAVPLTLILHDPLSGVPAESVVSVRVVTGKNGAPNDFVFKGPALSHLNDVVLKVDVDKGGQWKAWGKDQKAQATLDRIFGRRFVLNRVSRIEVVTSPEKKPSP